MASLTTENDEIQLDRRLLERGAKLASYLNPANDVQNGVGCSSVSSGGLDKLPAALNVAKNKRKRTKDGIEALRRDVQQVSAVAELLFWLLPN